MDHVRNFLDKMLCDQNFRNDLSKANSKEMKIKIIQNAGFDISKSDIKNLANEISQIVEKHFKLSNFNEVNHCRGGGHCYEPTNCGCSPMCIGPCTDENDIKKPRIYI